MLSVMVIALNRFYLDFACWSFFKETKTAKSYKKPTLETFATKSLTMFFKKLISD